MTDQELEQEIRAKGLNAARITPQDVEDSIAFETYFTALDGVAGKNGGLPDPYPDELKLVTFCLMLLKNGHRIVGVNTGPVSASNFDAELGRKLARQNAIDQIWPLLGYSLREQRFKLAQLDESSRNATPILIDEE